MSLRTDLQNFVTALVKTGPFYPVTYAKDGTASTGTKAATPVTVLINEVDKTWGDAIDRSGGLKTAADQWTFTLEVEFAEEVSAEAFEAVLETSTVMPKTATQPFVRIVLQRAEYSHPPRKEPNGGSRLTFFLVAQPAPK